MHKVTAPSAQAQSYCTICTCTKLLHTHLRIHKVTAHPSAHGQSNCTNSAHEHNKRTYLCKVISLICASHHTHLHIRKVIALTQRMSKVSAPICAKLPYRHLRMHKVTAPSAPGQSNCTHLRKVIALICACTKLMHTHLHICKVTAPIQCMSKVSAPICACAKESHPSAYAQNYPSHLPRRKVIWFHASLGLNLQHRREEQDGLPQVLHGEERRHVGQGQGHDEVRSAERGQDGQRLPGDDKKIIMEIW